MFRHDSKLKVVGVVVTAIVGGAFVLRALDKVLAGHGFDTNRTAKGVFVTYAGAAVMAGIFVLCVVGAFIARWWHYRQERRYEEIIKAREANTDRRKTTGTGS